LCTILKSDIIVSKGVKKMYTKSQNKATQKYQRENLEQVRFWVKKGEKDRYKELAEKYNMSLAELLRQAVEEYAENHK